MSTQEIWRYLWSLKIESRKTLGKQFIWVSASDFESVRSHFVKEYNIFYSNSMRSSGYFRHIHALDLGEYIALHRDVGNVARFLPLGIIHFFLDVAPFLLLMLLKWVPMKHFSELKQKN